MKVTIFENVQWTLKSTDAKFKIWVEILLPNKHLKICVTSGVEPWETQFFKYL